jgi:osmotically-inducible protein OsmY
MTGVGTRGRFRGRGPTGYRRSDDRIRDDVSDRLMEHDEIDAGSITVSVDNGTVTLSGSVDERRQKYLAEEVAESVMGVQDVQNQVRVQRGERTERSEESPRGPSGAERSTTSTSGRTATAR